MRTPLEIAGEADFTDRSIRKHGCYFGAKVAESAF
jgi:hypothetical protein